MLYIQIEQEITFSQLLFLHFLIKKTKSKRYFQIQDISRLKATANRTKLQFIWYEKIKTRLD
jgi:hypothetical protein